MLTTHRGGAAPGASLLATLEVHATARCGWWGRGRAVGHLETEVGIEAGADRVLPSLRRRGVRCGERDGADFRRAIDVADAEEHEHACQRGSDLYRGVRFSHQRTCSEGGARS